jgi:putative DNA primase/helicase
VLVAIDPDDESITAITARRPDEIRSWVERWNGTRNLYYTVNCCRGPMTKKPTKADIGAIEFVLGDLDPKADESAEAAKARYRPQLENMQPQSSAVIDSGNGLQGLWRLATPIPLDAPVPNAKGKLTFGTADLAKIKDVEARSKALMVRLGSVAGTQNIDRILRLPGTINLPTAPKAKAGRVPCPAVLLWANWATCALEDFPLPEAPKRKRKGSPSPDDDKAVLPAALRQMLFFDDHGAGVAVGGYPSRNELLWAFICAALRKGIDENVIVTAILDPAHQGYAIYEHVQENGGEDYVKRQIERAANEMPAVDEKDRTIIKVEEGKIDITWRATQEALIAHNCPVYVRGNKLVQPLWRWERAAGDDREVLTAYFERLNVDRLADITGHHAVQFIKFDSKLKREKDIDPPDKVMKRLLEIKHWHFPTVIGIINAPTLRADGSLLTAEGYDKATQLWHKSSGEVVLPAIPERPTKAQAQAALAKLNGLLEEFPFEVNEGETKECCVSRSVVLAGMMTTALRGALLAAVPGFLINAPEARTGKTYLVNTIGVLATGHVPPSTAGASEDRPDEIEKRIETAALSGRPIMHLNNLPNGMFLDSARLSELITEGIVNIRKLGRHEEGQCDCRATTVFLNGNNVQVAGDLVPRILLCRLDAEMETPETRTFKHDPIAMVRADRGGYLAAVFTIVRWWLKADEPRPTNMHRVAGFDRWSQLVQQPLIALGMPDPYGNITRMRTADTTLDELVNLLKALREVFGENEKFTVAMCRERANSHLNLREIIQHLNPNEVSRLLQRHEGRARDGWRYNGTEKLLHGAKAYRLVNLGQKPPEM